MVCPSLQKHAVHEVVRLQQDRAECADAQPSESPTGGKYGEFNHIPTYVSTYISYLPIYLYLTIYLSTCLPVYQAI